MLRTLARGAECVVEVGVAEGATSRQIVEVMSPTGTLYMVDSYPARVRLEQWLGLSLTALLARRAVRRFESRTEFVRLSSDEAAAAMTMRAPAQLVFLDAQHDYDSVARDLAQWGPKLAPDGRVAVHDSNPTPTRPELHPDIGGCRAVREATMNGLEIVATADSLAVLRRRDRRADEDAGGRR
jgi:predicted O-methyltransferase YrrM